MVIWTGENYLSTNEAMQSKYLTRNLILFVILTLFISIVCIVNNHVKAAYPDADSVTYIMDDLVHQSDNVDFQQKDTIVYRDDSTQADLFPDNYYVLFINETDQSVLAAKNVHQRMYPASMTKMMTAIVVADAVEAGSISLDDMVTITQNYDLTAEDVAPSQLHRGYSISVKDLLYGLMLESNNYYALYLAEYVAGDVQSFCDRMNEKAMQLGATNTHFMNPHGLDNPNHYSTAYDMYLIIKEVHNHQILRDIDGFDTYTYTFYDSNGSAIDTESTATNLFVTGDASLPAPFQLESWKTGTTDGAGNCLAMYLKKDGKDYVVVASAGNSKADLYDSIIRLLCLTD
jgi:D-alanyl-D-alanine carboxypeptidase (penicillin-binding protein 5/6)